MAVAAEAAPPPWLRIGECAADPGALLPDLAVLADIAPRWRELARALLARGVPADLSSPANLLALVLAAATRREVRETFASLGLAATFDAIERRHARLTAADQPWSELLRPVALPGQPITLTLPPRPAASPRIPDAATLRIAERGIGALRCATGTRGPFAWDEPPAALLRLDLTAATSDTALAFFFRSTDSRESVASALLRCVPALPDPFNLRSIRQAAALAGLEGITFTFTGVVDPWMADALGGEAAAAGHANWLLSLRVMADGLVRVTLGRGPFPADAPPLTGEWPGGDSSGARIWRALAATATVTNRA